MDKETEEFYDEICQLIYSGKFKANSLQRSFVFITLLSAEIMASVEPDQQEEASNTAFELVKGMIKDYKAQDNEIPQDKTIR